MSQLTARNANFTNKNKSKCNFLKIKTELLLFLEGRHFVQNYFENIPFLPLAKGHTFAEEQIHLYSSRERLSVAKVLSRHEVGSCTCLPIQ